MSSGKYKLFGMAEAQKHVNHQEKGTEIDEGQWWRIFQVKLKSLGFILWSLSAMSVVSRGVTSHIYTPEITMAVLCEVIPKRKQEIRIRTVI